MNSFFDFPQRLIELDKKAISMAEEQFDNIAKTTAYNQQKVLHSFIKNGVSESHFTPSTGYGYGDRGREVLEQVFADCVGAEDALIRHSIVSGTHAITIALFGVLRPGDTLLAAMNRLGQEELIPIREITPGVVLSQIRYREHTYNLLSKSGGFGSKDLLAQLQEIICK